MTALAPAARHGAAQGAAAAAAAHLQALHSPQLEPRRAFSRPPRMAPTPTSMSSHGAATRLAMSVAVRRLQLMLVHWCTCRAERCAPAQQETHAARRTRAMPRSGVARRSRGSAARRMHSHRAECCTQRRTCAPRCAFCRLPRAPPSRCACPRGSPRSDWSGTTRCGGCSW